jgi:hypothetical protein
MLRSGTMVACALATLTGSLALMRCTIGDDGKRATRTVAEATIEGITANPFAAEPQRRATPRNASAPAEPLWQTDTTGLLQPPLSIDALLDELNTDIGTAAMPVDREEFAAVLRTDRELRKSLID